jgi:hypothetical protein
MSGLPDHANGPLFLHPLKALMIFNVAVDQVMR